MNNKDLVNSLIGKLYNIFRSITGIGVRETLLHIEKELPNMDIHFVKSGTKVFDWTVPKEWDIYDAYIIRVSDGKKLIDFYNNNLHIVHYSTSVNKVMTKDQLSTHIHTLPDQPNAIPYVTSYYNKTWGFCMKHTTWNNIFKDNEEYKVVINSEFVNGGLNYGEIILPGRTKKTILISTYICHPSMANDNLSGVIMTTLLAKYLSNLNNYYTYRIVFLPETIGSIAYIATQLHPKNIEIIGGYVVSCVGFGKKFNYISTRQEKSLTNKITEYVLSNYKHNILDFTECGSDERQYNFPNVGYNIGSITRAKHSEYPEYHTSLDNLSLMSVDTILGTLSVYKKCINIFEISIKYICPITCEPHMSKYNLYPTISVSGKDAALKRYDTKLMMNILRYCDGKMDLFDISKKLHTNIKIIHNIAQVLFKNNLLEYYIPILVTT